MTTTFPAGLPIIDVAALRTRDGLERAAAAEAIGAAARHHGFFYVRNHGVPVQLQQEVFEQSQAFFALPLERKLALDKALSRCNRGYEKLRDQALEANSPPDLKEGFYIGEDLPPNHPRVLAGRFNQGPNQWPSGLPEFRPTMSRYYAAMMHLSAVLMAGVAEAMRLPAAEFETYMADPMGTLRLLHYPPQPANPAPGEKGCGAHTDFGGLTLLMQDGAGEAAKDQVEFERRPPAPDDPRRKNRARSLSTPPASGATRSARARIRSKVAASTSTGQEACGMAMSSRPARLRICPSRSVHRSS